MVDLVRAGRDPEELAREFEPTSQSGQIRTERPFDLRSPLSPALDV
jgi:hypothetical protein